MKILIDLSILRHPYCGLGQLAIGYGSFYASHPDFFPPDCRPTLLVPKEWVGRFGSSVDYLPLHDAYRIFPFLMPRFDVWHSIYQLSAFRPSRRSTRRILTVHDVNFVYEKKGLKRQRYIRRLQRECDSAAEVCFISHFSKNDALRFVDLHGRDAHVIYSGATPVHSLPQSRPAAVQDGDPFFLSIGVLKPKKNVHTLLPMMQHLPGYRLFMAGAGGGEYAERLSREAAEIPQVQILGAVSDEERNWLFAHCCGLLFPSLFEGFGRPLIEAMQWGKPVFCSTSTSLPEFGSSHAFYFSDFDPQSMAAVVKKGMSAFGPQQAADEIEYAEKFSYERHMEQYLRLYLSR